jgi:hypothetical protein
MQLFAINYHNNISRNVYQVEVKGTPIELILGLCLLLFCLLTTLSALRTPFGSVRVYIKSRNFGQRSSQVCSTSSDKNESKKQLLLVLYLKIIFN